MKILYWLSRLLQSDIIELNFIFQNCFAISGHMLRGLARQHDEDWLEACRDKCCTRRVRFCLFL